MNILCYDKGTNWGALEEPMFGLCRALIRSVVQYDMEIYLNLSMSDGWDCIWRHLNVAPLSEKVAPLGKWSGAT